MFSHVARTDNISDNCRKTPENQAGGSLYEHARPHARPHARATSRGRRRHGTRGADYTGAIMCACQRRGTRAFHAPLPGAAPCAAVVRAHPRAANESQPPQARGREGRAWCVDASGRWRPLVPAFEHLGAGPRQDTKLGPKRSLPMPVSHVPGSHGVVGRLAWPARREELQSQRT